MKTYSGFLGSEIRKEKKIGVERRSERRQKRREKTNTTKC